MKAGSRASGSVRTRWRWLDITQKAWSWMWKRSAATASRKPSNSLVAFEGRRRNCRCEQRRVTMLVVPGRT